MPVVRLDAVQVALGGRLLLDVPRLVIEAGEQVAIVGPNGAGKSTLLKLIAGQIPARQGSVRVLGWSIGPDRDAAAAGAPGRRALRRDTGLLMQGLHLVPRLTARENVLIGALGRLQGGQVVRSLLRWYPPSLLREADARLAALDLTGLARTRADRLSGGERQKVALARVQLQRPRLVLADEPTSALDPEATRRVCQALRAMASDAGRTLVTVVHDLDLLPMLATRVIGLADGRLAWDRPLADVTPPMLRALYRRPAGSQPGEAADAAIGRAPFAGTGPTRCPAVGRVDEPVGGTLAGAAAVAAAVAVTK